MLQAPSTIMATPQAALMIRFVRTNTGDDQEARGVTVRAYRRVNGATGSMASRNAPRATAWPGTAQVNSHSCISSPVTSAITAIAESGISEPTLIWLSGRISRVTAAPLSTRPIPSRADRATACGPMSGTTTPKATQGRNPRIMVVGFMTGPFGGAHRGAQGSVRDRGGLPPALCLVGSGMASYCRSPPAKTSAWWRNITATGGVATEG